MGEESPATKRSSLICTEFFTADAQTGGIEAALDGSFKGKRPVGRPKMYEVLDAVAKAARVTAAAIRERRGSMLRGLAAWIGWHEGPDMLPQQKGLLRTLTNRRKAKFEDPPDSHSEVIASALSQADLEAGRSSGIFLRRKS